MVYLPGKNWSRKYLCNWISKPVLARKDKKKYFLLLCWSPQKVCWILANMGGGEGDCDIGGKAQNIKI